MEIILFIIMSILISLGIETVNELSIFKEIASLGYKLDLNKIDKYIDIKDNNRWLFMLMIPGLNIVESIKRLNKYSKYKTEIHKIIDDTDLFIKLDDEVYDDFLDNPKSINAFNILFDYNSLNSSDDYMKPKGIIMISNGVYRQDNNDGTFNDISFRNEDHCIVVTRVMGEISKLDTDKQIEELNKIFYTLYKKKVIIEKIKPVSQKELLLEHRKNILNLNDIDDTSITLKL